jgi:hypothetical protein
MNANGNDQLPEHRQKQVEAGLAQYQVILAERDALDGRVSELCKTNAGLTVQLEALKSVVTMMESTYLSAKLELENRVLQYQQERDGTVRENARLEAVLTNCFVVLQRHMKGQD